jgi:hypothetical protein
MCFLVLGHGTLNLYLHTKHEQYEHHLFFKEVVQSLKFSDRQGRGKFILVFKIRKEGKLCH